MNCTSNRLQYLIFGRKEVSDGSSGINFSTDVVNDRKPYHMEHLPLHRILRETIVTNELSYGKAYTVFVFEVLFGGVLAVLFDNVRVMLVFLFLTSVD